MKEMIFWGATGQAKVLKECLKNEDLKLVALFDNAQNLSSPFKDVPLYIDKQGFKDWLKKNQANKNQIHFLVAIGGDKGEDRVEIQKYLQSQGLVPLIAKHPTAFIAENAQIGSGSQILANASVCVETVMVRGCIINTGAIVDHECFLDDGVHVCPGARLAGCVEVGRYSMIGTGAVILPRIKLGEKVIVGAGAVVLKDVPSFTVVAGNPANFLRYTEE
jgi:sugar O-acyltransferase (sialic acid O-acetyltransferase NeuD family)